jgi:hypothetical protein
MFENESLSNSVVVNDYSHITADESCLLYQDSFRMYYNLQVAVETIFLRKFETTGKNLETEVPWRLLPAAMVLSELVVWQRFFDGFSIDFFKNKLTCRVPHF